MRLAGPRPCLGRETTLMDGVLSLALKGLDMKILSVDDATPLPFSVMSLLSVF